MQRRYAVQFDERGGSSARQIKSLNVEMLELRKELEVKRTLLQNVNADITEHVIKAFAYGTLKYLGFESGNSPMKLHSYPPKGTDKE